MRKLVGILAIAGAVLSGCAVYVPSRPVVVESPRDGGNFCPPGQAKNGNC